MNGDLLLYSLHDNAPCHRRFLESEDIERMDWPARGFNPIEHVWDRQTHLPPVTIRELRLALQDEWAAMPQQLIDSLSMGRRCETYLAVREIISPTKDRMFPGMFRPSVALMNIFFIPLKGTWCTVLNVDFFCTVFSVS
ncbi:transposable element Tc3 transposase [Trichonephila clavipes]|nr:transposable element Tc3 transposase [Trichonephila clavipes]